MTKLIDLAGNLSLFVVVFWATLGSLYTVATAWNIIPETKDEKETKFFGIILGSINIVCCLILVLYFVNVVWRR